MNAAPLVLALAVACFPALTHAHGRLLDPPSRMSAWRFGFKVPVNYNDNQMYCGGFNNQWNLQGGKCGICGDPWQGPRNYERPNGRYVKNLVITKTYKQGATIEAEIEVTANHLGWFEFRLCDVAQSGGVEATHACLNQHVLADRTGKTRFNIGSKKGDITFRLVLPPGMTCDHCVFQWKWHCGNNVGYGIKQEEFYACSDVAITASGSPVMTTASPITTPQVPPYVTTPQVPPYVTTRQPVVTPRPTPAVTTMPTAPPNVVTVPPNVMAIITDTSRPLKDRIRYYVQYQKSVNNGYTIWAANKVNFVQRENPNTSFLNNGYNQGYGNGGSQVGGGGAGAGYNGINNNNYNGASQVPSQQANILFCRACEMGCLYDDCTKQCPQVCPQVLNSNIPG